MVAAPSPTEPPSGAAADSSLGSPADTGASRRAALRQVIADLERGRRDGGRPRRAATGFKAIDRELPDGGLALGAVHEITGPLAHGFAARLLARLSGPVLWFRPQTEKALLYAPALQALGCRLESWLIAYTPSAKALLWGLEQSLRSGAVEAVIGEPQAPLSMTASRRLQLAAERGKTLGLILSRQDPGAQTTGQARLNPSTLTSRWRVRPLPVATQPAAGGPQTGPDTALWQVQLLKHRNAGAASWTVPVPPATGKNR